MLGLYGLNTKREVLRWHHLHSNVSIRMFQATDFAQCFTHEEKLLAGAEHEIREIRNGCCREGPTQPLGAASKERSNQLVRNSRRAFPRAQWPSSEEQTVAVREECRINKRLFAVSPPHFAKRNGYWQTLY